MRNIYMYIYGCMYYWFVTKQSDKIRLVKESTTWGSPSIFRICPKVQSFRCVARSSKSTMNRTKYTNDCARELRVSLRGSSRLNKHNSS